MEFNRELAHRILDAFDNDHHEQPPWPEGPGRTVSQHLHEERLQK